MNRLLVRIALLVAVVALVSAVPATDLAGTAIVDAARQSKPPKATASPRPSPTPAPTASPKPSPTPLPSPTPFASSGACRLFPSTNVWNKDVSALPVRSDSATILATIGLSTGLHPDFSSTAWNNGAGYGIPYNIVGPTTPTTSVTFQYASESDPGPYPIPASPVIEADSDKHLLLWDTTGCKLYELWNAVQSKTGAWTAGSGAIWDLTSNALRPDGWTSADAAGLPILPGLVRYDEVAAGVIAHALRFTVPQTRSAHIYPARHDASTLTGLQYPEMGLRVRLKASFDTSAFPPQARVVLEALKRYGMLLADNGSAWYITGAPDPRWDDNDLHSLGQVTGADLEVVDTSTLVNG